MRVLAVDHDDAARLLTATAVRDFGHECVVAADGDEAWRIFTRSGADTVICDLHLPVQDGLALCRAVRGTEAGAQAYFILATAAPDRALLAAGAQAGVDDYLRKPVDLDELRVRLTTAGRITGMQQQLAHREIELERVPRQLSTTARRDALTGLRNELELHDDLEQLEGRVARHGHAYH